MIKIMVNKTGDYPDCSYITETLDDAMKIANRQRKDICDSVIVFDRDTMETIFEKEIQLDGTWQIVEDNRKNYLQNK